MTIPAKSEPAKAAKQGNQTMTKKPFALLLLILLAFIGVFASLSVATAQLRQGPSDGLNNTGESRNATPLFRNQVETQKFQTQAMLDSVETKRTELLLIYGAEHPEVKLWNLKRELLEAELFDAQSGTRTRAGINPDLSESQHMLILADQDASRAAVLCLDVDSMGQEFRRSVRLKLQKAVKEAFDLRMQLQTAQLDDAQAKIDASRQRLAKRQTLADQIVKRRASELIERYETEHNVAPNKTAADAKPSDSSKPTLADRGKLSEVDESLSRYPTFDVAAGLEGYFADIPELEGEWRLQKLYVDSTHTPVDGSPSLRVDSNKLQVSGVEGLFNDSEDLRVYLLKEKANKLLVWNSSSRAKEFHLASYQVSGSQLRLAIQKTVCDLEATYRLPDFPALKPASNVIYLQCEASIGLRSLDGLGFGDSEHYFSVQNTLQEGETILEHAAGELEQIGDANRIAALQGRWTANKISLGGEEIALADSFKLYLQNTYCVQLGTGILSHEHDKSVRMFAHPNFADSFIVIKSHGRGQPSGYVGSFSRQDATLRLAIQKFGEDNLLPDLKPGKGVLYAELREQDPLFDPVQLQFIRSETTPENGTLHLFDARNSHKDTAYRITRLECDTAYGRDFQQVDRLETQITLKPGEVRRIEVPVSNGDSDWRVWVRGGPADEITSEKWTAVIGFFDKSREPSRGTSKTQPPVRELDTRLSELTTEVQNRSYADRLSGRWLELDCVRAGEQGVDHDGDGVEWRFATNASCDRYLYRPSGEVEREYLGPFSVDTSQNPVAIDFALKRFGKTHLLKGIVKQSFGQATVALPGKIFDGNQFLAPSRPTTFDSTEQNGHRVFKLIRETYKKTGVWE